MGGEGVLSKELSSYEKRHGKVVMAIKRRKMPWYERDMLIEIKWHGKVAMKIKITKNGSYDKLPLM